jgi:DNA-binding MarR family transcriptional regulator
MPVTPSPHDTLVDAMSRSAFATIGALGDLAAEQDMSLPQFRLLAILRGRRLRMSAVAEHLGIEKSSMSGLVERSERRGLVERAPGATDGRVVEVGLTAAGDELAAALNARVAGLLEPALAGLDAGEREQLRALLVRTLE